jgi:hypothetical protein
MDNIELLHILKQAVLASMASVPLSYLVSLIYRKNYDTLFGRNEERRTVLRNPTANTMSAIVGFLERIIYITGWLIGKPEIIAIILGFKLIPSLREIKDSTLNIKGWHHQNSYFIGTFLSLLQGLFFAALFK